MDELEKDFEERRLQIQAQLDAQKTAKARNKLGQFATPVALADEIMDFAAGLLPEAAKIRFLDPAFGTGAFYGALRKRFQAEQIDHARGFEIDPHYGVPATELWEGTELQLSLTDFTKQQPNEKYNLVVCNPPYVRHHHLSAHEKVRLQTLTEQQSGVRLSGLAGLYCYFLALSQAWMADGGMAAWLIPSEFMDVNYGKALKNFLLNKVTLLKVHRFEPNDVQFSDALVSSAVVWFRNSAAPRHHEVTFSFGGTHSAPKLSKEILASELAREAKWTRFPSLQIRVASTEPTLSEFFKIKRGLATGNNNFFILPKEEICRLNLPRQFFRPVLPSPRYVQVEEIHADCDGNPIVDKPVFLLDCRLSEEEIEHSYPALWNYILEGKNLAVNDGYLCSRRSPWYSQEERPAPPMVCTYIGRSDTVKGRPFRFILNQSQATVTNVYLAMYPTPNLSRLLGKDTTLLRRIWALLNSLEPSHLLGEGRVYGGGLHKLEPRELANLPAKMIADLLPAQNARPQQGLFDEMVA